MTHQEALIVVYGESLVDVFENVSVVGGAPFNVARHLAGLHQQPLFISAIGKDSAGELIMHEFEKFKLSRHGVQVIAGKSSGTVQVHESAEGHAFEIMADCAYDYIGEAAAIKSLNAFVSDRNIQHGIKPFLYHGSLGLRGDESRKSFFAIKKALQASTGLSVYLDLNWREGHVSTLDAKQIVASATVLKVSIEELQLIQPWFNVHTLSDNKLPKKDTLDVLIQALMAHINATLLLVTYGHLGSAAFDENGRCMSVATVENAVQVVDTVGAGDAFSSVMLLALVEKWPLDMALKRANAFAGHICAIRGAIPDRLDFYARFIDAWN